MASSTNDPLLEAARAGDVGKIQAALIAGETDLDGALAAAAENGHLLALERLKTWGATEFEGALMVAARAGQTGALKYLLGWKDWGSSAQTISEARIAAQLAGHPVADEILRNWADDICA